MPTPDPAGRYTPITGMSQAIVPGNLNNDGIVSQSELNTVLTNYWPNSPWVNGMNLNPFGILQQQNIPRVMEIAKKFGLEILPPPRA